MKEVSQKVSQSITGYTHLIKLKFKPTMDPTQPNLPPSLPPTTKLTSHVPPSEIDLLTYEDKRNVRYCPVPPHIPNVIFCFQVPSTDKTTLKK